MCNGSLYVDDKNKPTTKIAGYHGLEFKHKLKRCRKYCRTVFWHNYYRKNGEKIGTTTLAGIGVFFISNVTGFMMEYLIFL